MKNFLTSPYFFVPAAIIVIVAIIGWARKKRKKPNNERGSMPGVATRTYGVLITDDFKSVNRGANDVNIMHGRN